MKIIKSGITRLVIVTGNVAIKIPNFTKRWAHFLSGLLSNMQEGSTWKYSQVCPDIYKPETLCPVLWHSWGGWLLIMRRVDRVCTWEEFETIDTSEHKKANPGDDKAPNYGWLSGKVVKLDYGSCDYMARMAEDLEGKRVYL